MSCFRIKFHSSSNGLSLSTITILKPLIQNMIFILSILLLATLTNQINLYLGKAQSACFFNHSALYFNFTIATYDPPLLDLQTELIIIEDIDFCTPIKGLYEIEVMKSTKSSKVAMMAPRGNCTFLQKTLNAQSLGVELLIVYDRQNGGMVQMGGSSQALILINSIFISAIDAANIKALYQTCYLSKIKISNTTQIPKQNRELSTIQLPDVFFDINDLRQMEYLSQFYRDQLYDAFIAKMQLNHRLVYTSESCNKNECDLQKDCLLSSPLLGDNYICYKPPNYQHSGKRIMKQQIRSLAILQVLGQKIWFIYRQIFYHNMCHYDEQIQYCVNKTLAELQVTQNQIKLIENKVALIQQPSYLKPLLQNGSILKIEPKYEHAYGSQIPSLFIRLCSTLYSAPAECDIFKQKPKQIKVEDNKANYYDFKYTSSKFIYIEINSDILESLSQLSIVITTKPEIFNSMANIDMTVLTEIFMIPTIMGRFGFVSNISESNLQFTSKSDIFHNGYLVMKKNQIVSNKLTLLLNLDKKQVYKMMIWAEPQKHILRNNNEVNTIIEGQKHKNFIVQYTYEDNEKQNEFILSLQSKVGYYSAYQIIGLYRYQNQTIGVTNILKDYYPLLSTSSIRQLSDNSYTHYMYGKQKQLANLKKVLGNCQSKINQKSVLMTKCKFVVNAYNPNSLATFIKVSLLKFESRTLNIVPLNSILQTTISPQASNVQRIKLDSKSLSFRLNDFKIATKTNFTLKFKHQYRLLKQNCQDFQNLQEWNRQYLNRTQLLYHEEQTNRVNYTSTMMMKHPYNAIKQHLKIRNITIFLVYKINPTLTQYLPIFQEFKLTKYSISQNQLVSNSYSEYLTNERFISSTGYSMKVDDASARKIKSNTLLQIPIKNQNVRVFVRTYTRATVNLVRSGKLDKELSSTRLYKFLRPKYYDNFTHYIHGYTDTQRHQHPKYLQLVQYIYLSMRQMFPQIKAMYYENPIFVNFNSMKYVTVYETYVEMIDRSTPLSNQKIYLIGNTLSNNELDPFKNLTNSKTSLTLSNPLASYNNFFQIVSKKMIRILCVESIFAQLTNKIQICTYKQLTYRSQPGPLACYNYSQYNQKYWKDLQSGKIYSGLKLIQSVGRVKIQIPPQNLAISQSTNQSYHQLYQRYQKNLDFYIKIKFNDFDKMVQVQAINNTNNTEYEVLLKGNDEDIINQYRNQSKDHNNTDRSKEQAKKENSTKQKQVQIEKQNKDNDKQIRQKQKQMQKQKQKEKQKEQDNSQKNTTEQTLKEDLAKQAEELKKQKKEFEEQKSLIMKQNQEIKKQKQELMRQTQDLKKQKEELVKQKLDLVKQKKQILLEKEETIKQKQALIKKNEESNKLKQEALKEKQDAKKEKEQASKQSALISTAKLQISKQQQELLKQLQDAQKKQSQFLTEKDQFIKEKQQVAKIKEKNIKDREEIEKKQQRLKQRESNQKQANENKQIDAMKPINSSNSKQQQIITADNQQNKQALTNQTNQSETDVQLLYRVIGGLMLTILILFCFIIFTMIRLHKLLRNKVGGGGGGPASLEEQSESKIEKGASF